MKTEKEYTDDHQVKVTAEFEQDVLDGFKKRGARKIAKTTRIPGFRPGKAPYNVILNHVGEGAILEEAIDLMLDDVYPELLKQENIEPSGPGNLEEIKSQEPPVFVFSIPLAPVAELGNLDKIKKPYELQAVTDDDVDHFIDQMRQQSATIVPFEGEAKVGQLVYFTLEAIDENPSDAEDAVLVKSAPQQTLIPTKKEESDTEWPFPGFAREFIGKKAEDKFSIQHSYEDKEKYDIFAGKNVRFNIDLQSVKELELPAIDEEFLKQVGGFESEDALRQAVRDKLENDGRADYDSTYYTELLDLIREQASLKYPPQMVEDEEHDVLHQIEHSLEHRGLDLDVYLKMKKIDHDQFMEEEVKSVAHNRLERSIVMDAIRDLFDVKVDDKDLSMEFSTLMTEMLVTGEFETALKELGKGKFQEYLSTEAARNALVKAIRLQLRKIAAPESIPAEEVKEETAEVTEENEADSSESSETPVEEKAEDSSEKEAE